MPENLTYLRISESELCDAHKICKIAEERSKPKSVGLWMIKISCSFQLPIFQYRLFSISVYLCRPGTTSENKNKQNLWKPNHRIFENYNLSI